MNYLSLLIRRILEGIYFIIGVGIIFDITTTIMFKLSLANEILNEKEIVLFGILACSLGIVNVYSKRFFGLKLPL